MKFFSTIRRGGRKLYSLSGGMNRTREQFFNQQQTRMSTTSTLKLMSVTILSFVSSLALYTRPPPSPGKYDVESTWLSWVLLTVFCFLGQKSDPQVLEYQPLRTGSPSSLDFATEGPLRRLSGRTFPFLAVTAGILSGTIAAKDCLVSYSRTWDPAVPLTVIKSHSWWLYQLVYLFYKLQVCAILAAADNDLSDTRSYATVIGNNRRTKVCDDFKEKPI
jgi:hypothetical protein